MHASGTTRRLAFVTVLTTIVTVLVYLVTVTTRTGQLLGELMLGGRPPDALAVDRAEAILATVSLTTLALGSVVIVAVGILQRRPALAGAALAAVAGANITTQLLKAFVLDREDLLNGLFYPLPNSFPSGHATAAASIAVGLLLVAPPALRAPTGLISAAAVAVFGAATIAAGWHRMGDALGGVGVAVGWGAAAGAVLAARRGVGPVGVRTARFGGAVATGMIIAGAIVSLAGSFAYLVVALDPLDVLLSLASRGGSPALYVLALALTCGVTLLAFGGLVWGLHEGALDPGPGSDSGVSEDRGATSATT